MSDELEHALFVGLLLLTQGLTWARVHAVERSLQDRLERRIQSNRRMTERRAADRSAAGAQAAGADRPGEGRRRAEE